MPRNEKWTPETNVDPGASAASRVGGFKTGIGTTVGALGLSILGPLAHGGLDVSRAASSVTRSLEGSAPKIVGTEIAPKSAKVLPTVLKDTSKEVKPVLEVPNPKPGIAPGTPHVSNPGTVIPDAAPDVAPAVNPGVDAVTQETKAGQTQQQQQTTGQKPGGKSKDEPAKDYDASENETETDNEHELSDEDEEMKF